MSTRIRSSAAVAALALGCAGAAQAQLVNYGEQLGAYKDNKDSGVRLIDATTPGVAAQAKVARALQQNRVVEERALVQPDGTLKLPDNQTNLVVRTDYQSVQQGANGQLRIASPSISGNVSGNVTLYVDGKGVQNITVLNNPR